MSARPVRASVSAIVINYADPEAARASVESLLRQTAMPVEVLVVDNSTDERLRLEVDDEAVRVLRPGDNVGYAAGCNLAAAEARGEWLFFLNADAAAEPDCLERLLEAVDGDVGVAGAQVLLPDGDTVNAGDNPVHITGLSWAGRYLEERETGPARESAAVSGAALLARADVFRDLGGYCEPFFLYHEDHDLCWRCRMAGWSVRFVPAAAVRHDYEFHKGPRKWFWLERNRLWMILSNYSLTSLLTLWPLLVAAELAIAWQARRDGWLREKARAWAALLPALPQIVRWRAQVQARRSVRDEEVVRRFVGAMRTPLVNSPMLDAANPWMELYRWVLLGVLRFVGVCSGAYEPRRTRAGGP